MKRAMFANLLPSKEGRKALRTWLYFILVLEALFILRIGELLGIV
jgi:hypothetical protein